MSRQTQLDYLNSGGYRSGRTIKENGDVINIADLMSRMNSSMTSFDELAVAVPRTQIDLKSVYPVSTLRDRITATNGTVTQENGGFVVSITDDPDAEILFRSVERGRYVAGYDGLAGMAVRLPTRPTGDQTIEFGYCDFVNGFVVGEDADGMYTAIYRGGVKYNVRRRADWNNPAPDDLDPGQLQVYRMAFRWYGRGPMKLAIAGPVGLIELDKSEITDEGPITFDPNQPLSIKLANNGTAAALNARVYGRQFFVLGDYAPNRRFTTDSRLLQSVGTTFVPLIAYREKDNGYRSISCKLQDVQLLAASADIMWEIRLNPTLTGGTWVNPENTNDGAETAIEANVSATAISGGITIYQGLHAAGQGNTAGSISKQLPGIELPGFPQTYVLCARAISGTATVSSVFNIAEEW